MKYQSIGFYLFLLSMWLALPVMAQEQVSVTTDARIRNNYQELPGQVFSVTFPHSATDYIAGVTSELIDVSFHQFDHAGLQIQSSTLISGDIGDASYEILAKNGDGFQAQQIFFLEASGLTDTVEWLPAQTFENYGSYDVSRWIDGNRYIVIKAMGHDNVQRKLKLVLK